MLKRILIAVAFVASTSVHSENRYIGLSVGQTELDAESFDKGRSLAISGGYKLSENLAVELSYISFGESDDDIDPVWTIELTGLNVAAIGVYPLSESASLFGKIGLLSWDGTLDEAGFGEIGDDSGTDVSFGIGVKVDLASQLDVVLEFQKFEMDDIEIEAENISVGARYTF